jgi:hypothetical protein
MIYPLQKGVPKDIISPVGCNSLVAMMLAYYGTEKERKKSLERGYVKDIGSTVGIQSYRGQGYERAMSRNYFVNSRYLHLYVMVVLSGTRVVRVRWVWEAAPCRWAAS